MPTCEYCGEDFAKGGAYATHVRYCADRPEEEENEEAESDGSADAASTESAGEESADGGGTERSGATSETRSTPPERESEAGSVTAEIRDRAEEDVDHEEPSFSSEPTNVPDQYSGKWLAAGVLVLFVVVVWILLRSGEEE